LKKLIGEDELDAAQRVLELMFERGIPLDARQVNGLIGAWVRKGSGNGMARAEEMAWKMINTRLAAIDARKTRYQLQEPLRTVHSPAKLDATRPFALPSATIETFNILIQQYRRRQQSQSLLDLFDTLRKAEIKPNTQFMNELLSMDTKTDRKAWAWNTYVNLTGHGVHPDFDTFTILWHHLCQSLTGIVRKGNADCNRIKGFVMPRALFAEMINQKQSLEKAGTLPRELYDFVIKGFSLAEDSAGTAVALRALQQQFKAPIGETTARVILLGLARLGQTNRSGHKSRRLNLKDRQSKQRLDHVTHIFHKFKQERDEALKQRGIEFGDLSDEAKLEEAIIVLSDLLRHAFRTKIEPEGRERFTTTEVCRRAAAEMGVPECIPWVPYNGAEI
jgi:hypothetical protein